MNIYTRKPHHQRVGAHQRKEHILSNRMLLAAVSDTHGGHKLGLCNPDTLLEDITSNDVKRYSPQISEVQKWMWETYLWGIDETIKLAGKDDIILLHNGDPTHGKASFLQLMSSRQSDQIDIAVANFDPWLQYENVKMIRFAVGTGIHEMGEGSSSITISKMIKAKHSHLDIQTIYHGLLNVGNFLVDYSHHGPSKGIRKWLEGNELRFYLRSIMIDDIMAGKRPPHLVLRGHYHMYRREFLEIITNGKSYESWIVLLPGFTFKDDYTRRATRSDYKQTVGMVIFELIDGRLYQTHRFTKTVDIRTKELYNDN